METTLHKFDISKIENGIVGILGKRGVGKTCLVNDILRNKNRQVGLTITNEEYKSSIVSEFIKHRVNYSSYLVFDDYFTDGFYKDECIENVFMEKNTHTVLSIFTIQSPLEIPPNLRKQIDYIFIFRENMISNKKNIYERYASIFPTFEMFCSAIDKYTDNYGCLVIDNSNKSDKLEDKVFWYKAQYP